ncbi:glycosyltransferase family 2 protein [Arthrobacter liuii]|uniref:Glycosyltransferase 2-like domain-containing protein n=1 Tax=Arthrobacter liuii TaxID=1476996 RepID=A0ABQ2AFW8_9MICC|nr:glycosyltransferase family 2 protein [Arthrobacter liuii]GGH91075.1 hypothetical protein GCM10007170_06370 [Arthrobacter liuii]
MTVFSLAIVIVTYNSADVIGACLQALAPVEDLELEIIVVDNASADDTADFVRLNYPEVRLIQNSENVGFAKAVNLGASMSGSDNLALVNPDAIVSSTALRQLLKIQDSRATPSIIAPRIIQPQGRLLISSGGHFPTVWRMLCHYFAISRIIDSPRFEGHYLLEHQLDALESVDWVTGAVWIIPTAQWRRLNGLTERWFMYAEDVEFCWRAKNNGLDVLMARDIAATHLVGGSSGHLRSTRSDWIVNLFDFYCSSVTSNVFARVAWKMVVCSGLMARSGAYLIKGMAVRKESDSYDWSYESRRFAKFSVSLAKAKSK